MSKKIAIIGYGFVGQAVHSGIKPEVEVFIHDPWKKYNAKVKQVDAAFICVGTPMLENGDHDYSQIIEAFHEASLNMEAKLIVIKSTVLPGVLDSAGITNNSTSHVVINPEFLNQNSAAQDFADQKLCVLGGFMEDCLRLKSIYQECFDIKIHEWEYCTQGDASMIKYIHNVYNAYKVLFWNYVNETIGDHRKVAKAYKKLRAGLDSEFTQVGSDGKPGYGGACFPKDVSALNSFFPHELTNFMKSFNSRIRSD